MIKLDSHIRHGSDHGVRSRGHSPISRFRGILHILLATFEPSQDGLNDGESRCSHVVANRNHMSEIIIIR